MYLRFWGVRGSVPWAIPAAIGHGCNTPCIEVTDEQTSRSIIFDAGSGIVGLGAKIGGTPRALPIVLTHYHWDHLQGLPFLAQLYAPGWKPCIYAPRLGDATTASVNTMFQSPYFPVPRERLPNRLEIELLPAFAKASAGKPSGSAAAAAGEPVEMTLNGFDVSSIALNHPGGALAYRIRGITGDVVYATDHEFGDPAYDDPLAKFCENAAMLILDAHFTPDELPAHKGWGHSDWKQCAEFAKRVDAGGLWLFHHKPGRTDEQLVRIRHDAQRVFRATDTASEGDAVQL
jgi:phosphoribosyl 1,2-cyclic phosphodiesterase